MHRIKTLVLSIILSFFFFNLIAQPKINSPYSRFGLGDLHNDNFFFSQGMGDLSATTLDPWHINLTNPASYSYLQSAAFEIGLDARYGNLKSASESGNVYSGNLNYFALGLPLINPINDALERVKRTYDLGLVFALKPHTTVGYNILSMEDHPDEGRIERSYVGDGGTYKFITGIGGRYKDFAFGINGGYLFGNINYRSIVYFLDVPFAYNDDFRQSFNVNGFIYNVGVTYSLTLNKSLLKDDENTQANKLIFGLYGNSSTSFNARGDIYSAAEIANLNLGNKKIDTLYYQEQIEGKGTLPGKIGAGISYQHGKKFMVGLNYESNFWSQYTNELKLSKDELLDSYKISIGADYVPDHFSYTNPFQRMHYRMGIYYKTDSRSENDKQFNEAALNLGLGVPFVFKRKTSHIDFSLKIGKTLGDRTISESFVKLGIGLTFNDQEWFLKRRYY
jgi:hypothetical protein